MLTKLMLIEMLDAVDDDCIVILQKDAEGNGYSPLAGVDADCVYEAETTWRCEAYPADEETPANAVPCVVLYPVN